MNIISRSYPKINNEKTSTCKRNKKEVKVLHMSLSYSIQYLYRSSIRLRYKELMIDRELPSTLQSSWLFHPKIARIFFLFSINLLLLYSIFYISTWCIHECFP